MDLLSSLPHLRCTAPAEGDVQCTPPPLARPPAGVPGAGLPSMIPGVLPTGAAMGAYAAPGMLELVQAGAFSMVPGAHTLVLFVNCFVLVFLAPPACWSWCRRAPTPWCQVRIRLIGCVWLRTHLLPVSGALRLKQWN